MVQEAVENRIVDIGLKSKLSMIFTLSTVFWPYAIDHAEDFVAPNGRPFKLADDGEPIRTLFA